MPVVDATCVLTVCSIGRIRATTVVLYVSPWCLERWCICLILFPTNSGLKPWSSPGHMAFNHTETWDSTGTSRQDFTISNACGIHLQLVDGVAWIVEVAIDCSGQTPIVCYPVWNPAEPAVQSIDGNTTGWIQYCVVERSNRRTFVVNVSIYQASHCRWQPNTSTDTSGLSFTEKPTIVYSGIKQEQYAVCNPKTSGNSCFVKATSRYHEYQHSQLYSPLVQTLTE